MAKSPISTKQQSAGRQGQQDAPVENLGSGDQQKNYTCHSRAGGVYTLSQKLISDITLARATDKSFNHKAVSKNTPKGGNRLAMLPVQFYYHSERLIPYEVTLMYTRVNCNGTHT